MDTLAFPFSANVASLPAWLDVSSQHCWLALGAGFEIIKNLRASKFSFRIHQFPWRIFLNERKRWLSRPGPWYSGSTSRQLKISSRMGLQHSPWSPGCGARSHFTELLYLHQGRCVVTWGPRRDRPLSFGAGGWNDELKTLAVSSPTSQMLKRSGRTSSPRLYI